MVLGEVDCGLMVSCVMIKMVKYAWLGLKGGCYGGMEDERGK